MSYHPLHRREAERQHQRHCRRIKTMLLVLYVVSIVIALYVSFFIQGGSP